MSEPAASAEAIERQVLAALEALGAEYEVLECDPEYADTAQFSQHYGIPLRESANCIVVASKKEPKQFCACVALATTRLDVNRTVKRLLGVSKASFATPEETRELTGMLIGGVTPFALPPDLPLYVDPAVLAMERVWVGGGSRSQKLAVAPSLLLQLPNAEVVEGLAIPLE